MIEAKILKPGYTQKEALVLLFNTDPKLDLLDIDEVYYPYVRLRYLVTVGKGRIMKKLNKLCDCIIDRVSGSVYETEGDPEFDYVEIPEDEALEIQTPLNECYDTGHSFALKQYIGKAKLMMTPEMQIIEEDIFYKKFYVVKARDPEEYTYFILVDAVDGGISVLDHEKHIEELAKEGQLEEAERVLESVDGDHELLEEMIAEKSRDYHRFITCCSRRLTPVIPTQQQKPRSSGLAPVRISLTILVLSPMAAIARTIKNLLRVFRGVKMSALIPAAETMVVATEARIK